jgi:hypothetical protein
MSKSHRAKALQSLIDAGPSTSAGELLPPASLVTNEKKSKKSAKKGIVGGKSSKGKAKKEEEDEVMERAALGQEEEEEVPAPAEAMDADEDMGDAAGWETKAPGAGDAMQEDDDADMLLDDSQAAARRIIQSDTTKPTPVLTSTTTANGGSGFAPISQTAQNKALLKPETRKITIPPHRMTPLKREWVNVYGPLVEVMGLMVRMNVKKRQVELKVSLGNTWGDCELKIPRRHRSTLRIRVPFKRARIS